MRYLLAATATLGMAACTTAAPPGEPGDLPALATERERPLAALAEHLLADYFSSDIVAPPTLCVATSEGEGGYEALPVDDEVALIERFEQLAPLTRCQWTGTAWQDSESGEPAMVFDIHSFACASETRCTGWAGYTAGSSRGEYAEYTLDWTGETWTFERDERRMLSQ